MTRLIKSKGGTIPHFEATTFAGLERAFCAQGFGEVRLDPGANFGWANRDGINHRFLIIRRLRDTGPFYKAVPFQAKTLSAREEASYLRHSQKGDKELNGG